MAAKPLCPECRDGKHLNCTGWALDPETDEQTYCGCPEPGCGHGPLPIKVRYDNGSCAYLDTRHPDGTFSGTNKYTDEPVTLRWDDEAEEWKP